MADPVASQRTLEHNQPPRSWVGRLLFVASAICVLVGGVYFAHRSGTDPAVYGNDFNVYYHAAREVMAGGDPYQHSLGEWTPYLYPPLLAELIVPLALLPLPVAAYVWFLINAASIVAAAWMSVALATGSGERDPAKLRHPLAESSVARAALAACATIVVLRFVLDNFNLGQVNAAVAALAVAHVCLYARNRKTLSAVALVFAVSIKLTPALLLLYHIAKLRLKFAAACVALLGAVTALSFLPFGASSIDAFQTFVNRTVKNEQGYDLAYAGNQSLRGAISRLTESRGERAELNRRSTHRPVDATTFLISIMLLGSAIFGAIRARSEVGVAPFFCCMVLLSPLSWKAHFVVLILPIAYLLVELKNSERGRRQLIAAALLALFALFNLTSPQIIGRAAAEWADAHSLVLIGALLIFMATVIAALTRKFGNPPHV